MSGGGAVGLPGRSWLQELACRLCRLYPERQNGRRPHCQIHRGHVITSHYYSLVPRRGRGQLFGRAASIFVDSLRDSAGWKLTVASRAGRCAIDDCLVLFSFLFFSATWSLNLSLSLSFSADRTPHLAQDRELWMRAQVFGLLQHAQRVNYRPRGLKQEHIRNWIDLWFSMYVYVCLWLICVFLHALFCYYFPNSSRAFASQPRIK